MPDARVFFTSGGSESVDTAMKLARLAHPRPGIPRRPSSSVAQHELPRRELRRPRGHRARRGTGPASARCWATSCRCRSTTSTPWARVCATHAGRIAAIISEPVQGAGGVHPPKPGYLEGLRALADQHGAYLIFDEVICGFGRLGTWWGAQYYGVTPDLVTFAKGVTSGYLPLGGVLVGPGGAGPARGRHHVHAAPRLHLLGPPDACAAGIANLNIMKREGLVERAKHIGARLGRARRAARTPGKSPKSAARVRSGPSASRKASTTRPFGTGC